MPAPLLRGAFAAPGFDMEDGRNTAPRPRFLAFQPLPSRVAGTLGAAPLFCQVRTRNTFVPQESEPKDILHRIEPWALAARPKRGPDRSLGKNAAVGGDMGQLDTFAGTGEDHLVLAHNVPAAQDRKADVALTAGSDIAIAGAGTVILERNPAPRGSRLPE